MQTFLLLTVALAATLCIHGAAFTMIRAFVAALGAAAAAPALDELPPLGAQRHGFVMCPACPMQLPKTSQAQPLASHGCPQRPLATCGVVTAAAIHGASGGGGEGAVRRGGQSAAGLRVRPGGFATAGVALAGDFVDLEYNDIDWIIGVNFWGVVHGTKEFLPHLYSV